MAKNDLGPFRIVSSKSASEIASEWSRIAHDRHRQIVNGIDLSYTHVLEPTIRRLLVGCTLDHVLEIGCGTGNLTAEIAGLSKRVVGVDFSQGSIEIAKSTCAKYDNVSFVLANIQDIIGQFGRGVFSTVVANMVLMTCVDLESCVKAVFDVLSPRGRLVATITHPCFWPSYRGYSEEPWFRYDQELIIEAPFRISNESTGYVTTQIHRPLSAYTDVLSKTGFVIERVLEPYPDKTGHDLYPERWKSPRFLAFRAFAPVP